MKSWLPLLLLSLVGLSGCVTNITTGEPYPCTTFDSDVKLFDEYVELVEAGVATNIRAWIRETDRVCHANNKLRNTS